MSTYTVVMVSKESSANGGYHRHLKGVYTDDGDYYSRQHVVDSINDGNVWQTSANGYKAKIHTLLYCVRNGCRATPYIATNPDSTKLDNLENLPEKQ